MIKLSTHPSITNTHSINYSLIALNQQTSSISFNHRGLAYGDGFFSTMGVYQGKVLWSDYHAKRLKSHAEALCLDFDVDWIIQQLQHLAKQIDEGVVKIICTRKQQSSHGYGFVNNEAEVFAQTKKQSMPAYHVLSESFIRNFQSGDRIEYTYTIPLYGSGNSASDSIKQPYYLKNQTYANTNPLNQLNTHIEDENIAVCLTSQIAWLPTTLSGLKTLNRLDSVLAAAELEYIKTQNQYLIDNPHIKPKKTQSLADTIDSDSNQTNENNHLLSDLAEILADTAIEQETKEHLNKPTRLKNTHQLSSELEDIIANRQIIQKVNAPLDEALTESEAVLTDNQDNQHSMHLQHFAHLQIDKVLSESPIVEGLVSDISGTWVEGTSSNVFYQLKGGIDKTANHVATWYTPPIDKSGINGVMRQLLLDKAEKSGLKVVQRPLNTDDLSELSALFFCNAVRGVIPIHQLHLLDTEKTGFSQVVHLSIDRVNTFVLRLANKVMNPVKKAEKINKVTKAPTETVSDSHVNNLNSVIDADTSQDEIQSIHPDSIDNSYTDDDDSLVSDSDDFIIDTDTGILEDYHSNQDLDKTYNDNSDDISIDSVDHYAPKIKLIKHKGENEDLSLFYALFHIQPANNSKTKETSNDTDQTSQDKETLDASKDWLDGAMGAYVNTYMLASNKVEFYSTVKNELSKHKLEIIEMEDYTNLVCEADENYEDILELDDDSHQVVKSLSLEYPLGMLCHVYDDA